MKILLVDDDEGFRCTTVELLSQLGHEVTGADSVAAAKKILQQTGFERVLLDLMLPDGNGLDILETLQSSEKAIKVTIITGHPAIKGVVKSVYGPNVNYLIKPISLQKLQNLLNDDSPSSQQQSTQNGFCGLLIGESKPMQKLHKMIERVAKTDANVMLFGESGVGKELVAQAIHQTSEVNGPFVTVNCGAFTRELINSELFGHEKGAFTGAVKSREGVFEQAKNGNLFLDEVTEMPLDLQPNLLRTLETKKVVRLGSGTSIDVNCRVISATNKTEQQLAEEDCLREDLYFRLAVFPIHIPALRERTDDIPLLASYFLEQLNSEHGTSLKLTEQNQNQLTDYEWPGNVRELRHTIHRAFILSDPDGKNIHLPKTFGSPFAERKDAHQKLAVGQTIEQMERRLIYQTLDQLDGNKKKAADMLGISLKTLYNRLNDYDHQDETISDQSQHADQQTSNTGS